MERRDTATGRSSGVRARQAGGHGAVAAALLFR